MKQPRLSHSRKLLRNALVCALTLATVFVFTVLATPVSALSVGDTIYVSAEEYEIERAVAYFLNNDGETIRTEEGSIDFVMIDEDQDGIFSVDIPEGAKTVYFLVSFVNNSYSTDVGLKYKLLSECTGNTFNLVTDEWYTLGSQSSTPSDDPAPDTTPNTSPDTTPESEQDNYSDEPGNNTQTITPSGKVGTTVPSDEIVSVDLSWQAMEFIYTPASQGTWNPDTHAYEGGNEASWSSTTNQISVTNHSNVGITAAFDFQSAENLDLEGEFHDATNQTVTSVDLESAADSADGAGTPTTQNVTFHITGGSISADTDALGTITVTITKKQ